MWARLYRRRGDAPEIGSLVDTSIVLEDWEMPLDERTWTPVKCNTPLVNDGKNVFEGWATFRTRFDYPGGERVLRCEAVGDHYKILIDDVRLGERRAERSVQSTWRRIWMIGYSEQQVTQSRCRRFLARPRSGSYRLRRGSRELDHSTSHG